ncbi:MAG: two pore domain potassium channel family protein [Gammaproteobacteria bacterium]|nr:two pore domain potassium channel family protein [Gammaproteobacteria bacterium]
MESIFNFPNTVAAVITVIVVVLCVLLHYEVLNLASAYLIKRPKLKRRRVLLLVFVILLTHIVEVWIFAIGFVVLAGAQFGELVGLHGHMLTDYAYYSATVYSTLGFGDIVPVGSMQLLTGTEAITGLVLITWSASFTFLEMHRFWEN